MTDPPATGFRRVIRSTLYIAHKYDLGCPTEAKCDLYKRTQEAACATCPKHLTPVEPLPDEDASSWLRFILHLESMVNVGCKFQPNDLDMQSWDGLIALSQERARMDRLIYKQRTEADKKERESRAAIEAARRESKIPNPGQSLFPKAASRRGRRR